MAGGKGTRMNSNEEKLLLTYKKPVILHVVDALQKSNYFSKIIAATSANSPKTEKILKEYAPYAFSNKNANCTSQFFILVIANAALI